MTPFCAMSLGLLFGTLPSANEISRQNTAAVIAALHAYEWHHGRDVWSWQSLQKARADVYDPLFAQRPLPAWLDEAYLLALRWYLLLELVALVGGAWFAWRLWCQKSSWSALACSITWFALLFSLNWVIAPDKGQIVVIKTDATILRQGNGLTYPPHLYQGLTIRLTSGVEATVRAQRSNGWIQISLPNEKVGWVPSDSVYFIK